MSLRWRFVVRFMVEFAATRELFDVAVDGQRAFRRFKAVLARYPEEREWWSEFSNRRLQARIGEWLESVGLLPGGEAEA